jgi:exodeoxyribonuclease VII small subunit
MEQGDISLEESLKAFERGIKLTRTCQQALQEAEQKVQILLEKNGQQTLEPFTNE